jgi:hypothetical protein
MDYKFGMEIERSSMPKYLKLINDIIYNKYYMFWEISR